MRRTQFGPFVQYQHSISSIKQPITIKRSVLWRRWNLMKNIQFPACDGGRKFREFQNNAFLSNESIVYNQATKIKVYPSECKINLIEFLAIRSYLWLSFRSLLKKFSLSNRSVFVAIRGAESFLVLVRPRGKKYPQNWVRTYGKLVDTITLFQSKKFTIFPSLFQTWSDTLFQTRFLNHCKASMLMLMLMLMVLITMTKQ